MKASARSTFSLALLLFLSLCTCHRAQAQTIGRTMDEHGNIFVFEYALDTIKTIVEADPGIYQALGRRFNNEDTSLTLLDYLTLYYGSAYAPSYGPYSEGLALEAVDALAAEDKLDEALELTRGIIEENPAFIKPYLYMGGISASLGDSAAAEIWYGRYEALLTIPYYSGSGFSADSAMVVRNVNDEYLILNYMGIERPNKQSLVDEKDNPFDVMTVQAEGEEEQRIYFNIAQPYGLGMKGLFGNADEKKTAKTKRSRKKKRKKRKRKE